MKKLLIVTAIVMLTASTVGCQCGRWFRRGAMVPYYPADPCCDPCPPPCDPCGTPGLGAMPMPGPETYVPTG